MRTNVASPLGRLSSPRLVAVFLMLFLVPRVLTAEEVEDVEREKQEQQLMENVNAAIALYNSGQYREAVEKFDQAYLIIPDPNILYNIARCYEQLGNKSEAIEHYRRFIGSDAPEDTKVPARENLARLEAELAAPVTDTPPPEPGPQPEAASGSSVQTQEQPAQPPRPATPKVSRAPEWVFISLGAAALVAGGVFSGLALNTHADFESTADFDQKKSLEDDGKRQALIGDIALGAGGVLALTGILMFIIRDGTEEASAGQTAIRYQPIVTSKGAGLAALLRF